MSTEHEFHIKTASLPFRTIASGESCRKRLPISRALCRTGKVGHYVDPFRNFESTELRAAIISQFTLSPFRSRAQNDRCLDTLTVHRVGLAERCRFEHF